jgi:hypothetical protein
MLVERSNIKLGIVLFDHLALESSPETHNEQRENWLRDSSGDRSQPWLVCWCYGGMRENIAQVVADGVAAGRKDGLRMAAEIVEEEFRTTAGAILDRLRKEISNWGITEIRTLLTEPRMWAGHCSATEFGADPNFALLAGALARYRACPHGWDGEDERRLALAALSAEPDPEAAEEASQIVSRHWGDIIGQAAA